MANAPTTPKPFKRTNVSLRERVISFIILGLLGVIGGFIFIKGRHFDPSRYALRTDALKSTAEASTVNAATLPTEETAPSEPKSEPTGESGEGEPATTPTPAIKAEPLEIQLPGIKPMSATEFYSPKNLYEKIDGRAPAYISFNFQQLRCRSFSVIDTKDSYVDLFEYRMDTPVNAFGIFGLERDPKGKPLTFVTDGYASEMGLFFRQGNIYVQVIASDQKPKTLELARAIAENRAKALPADDKGLDARRRLPASGLLPESVTYVQDSALGQPFLKDVFQATYNFDGAKLQFFVMVTTPEAATEAWKSFQKFCERFGKATVLPANNGTQVFTAEVFGTWKVIYERQGELGGVFDVADDGKARQFVEDYLKGKLK